MPMDALPPGFKDQAEGTNTDWNNPIQKYWHKSWFAYGPRSSHWWAKWREVPITLFAVKGKGPWRWEYSDASQVEIVDWETAVLKDNSLYRTGYYLSAIQYWTKWHFAFQWPLHIQAHYYIDEVPRYPEQAGSKQVFFIRIGARRDADRVYWCPSIFVGLQWN